MSRSIQRDRIVAGVVALCITITVAACASGSRTASDADARLDGGASWVLLAPVSRGADTRAPESVQVLAETRLRAGGVSRLVSVPTGPGSLVRTNSDESGNGNGNGNGNESGGMGGGMGGAARDAALLRAREDGHDHAVAIEIEEWNAGLRPGDRPRVALSVEVIDVADGALRHRERAVRTGRAGAGLAGTATRVVEALFDDLAIARSDADAGDRVGRTTPDAIAGDLMAGADPLSGSDDPGSLAAVAQALRSGGALAPVGFGLRAARGAPTVDAATADALDGRATAFFYGTSPPLAPLAQFDRVVLEPDNIRAEELADLSERGAATFAYLSVGEVGPARTWSTRIDASWVLGRNESWDSRIMDLGGTGWTGFLDARVDQLVAAGYDGLFLDTMDSYRLTATAPASLARQAQGLGDFVRRTKARYPALRLIANRGFEVLDTVGPYLEAIAAESLYARWDNEAMRYVAVPRDDRDWLLGQLDAARERHGLDVIAIDYLPPARRDEARAVAARIASHDFVPWVATPSLDHIGVGAIDVSPREVLLPYDSRVNGKQSNAEVHRLLATPLEYLGYVPVYHDIATLGLPDTNLAGRFAGIAYWSRGTRTAAGLPAWFEAQVDAGVPIALFGAQWIAPGSSLAARLGVVVESPIDADSARTRTQDDSIGFEKSIAPRLESIGRQALSTSNANLVHLGLVDGSGRQADLVLTGPWGGLAAHPGVVDLDLEDKVHWIVDPYAFLARALQLPEAPMPDVTSEGGKRLWLAHIDGDALPSWAELPGRQLGAEVIRDRIISRYRLPHTISIVESEMTSFPAYDDRRERMFAVARDLFAMDHVEIASHTFSHPLRWELLAAHDGGAGVHNLPVGDDYRYSPDREIGGSVAFIDGELAPPGKRTEVMLWSGDALPNAADLAAAKAAGLENVNGGLTTITRADPVLSLVTPMARTVDEHVQVYAPVMNENVYTNDWLGPFDGFRRVIETFEMTEYPRRLKPLSIYYHFYAGTKAASVRSLEEVYDWSLTQDIHPTTLSDYARRVRVFRDAGLARRLDGSWRLDGLGDLRSVRIIGRAGQLDVDASPHVTSARALQDGLYLATDGSDTVHVALGEVDP